MTDPTKLAEEFNKRFTSMNGIDVPERVSVPREEWRNLYGAIKQFEDLDRKACEELDCAEEVLDGLSVGLTMEQTDFDCIGDYIKAVFAAKPAPEQYTALQQALTRLQKRYGELEGKLAAPVRPVKAIHIGWDYLDNRQMVATYAVPVNAQTAPDLYTTPPAGPVAWREALERIADPRNTHFAGDAQVVAREALAYAVEAKLKGKNT